MNKPPRQSHSIPFRALNIVGPFFGLLLVLGLFWLSPEVRPYLFTGGNFKIILIQTVIVALGALGMTMIIVSGGIDLSVGSVVAFTSVLGATLLVKGSFHHRRIPVDSAGWRFDWPDQRFDHSRVQHDAVHRHPGHDGCGARRGQVAGWQPDCQQSP